MEHHFDIEVAKEFGVHAAVIYKNIQHWCLKNRSNEKHFYNGEYWTYNSVKAFNDLFPYLTESQIRTALNKLIENGWIGVGNYNSSSYDRTKWYCDLRKLHLSINTNGNENNHEPIPYNKPYSNTDEETTDINMSIESTFQKIEFDKSIKGDAELYKYGMDLYHDFVLKHSGVKPNITGTTGKALKYLITYFKGLSENKDYSEVKSHFENVFSNYETWDTFYKKNLKLEFISSNIVNIIKSIKDGKSTQQSNYKTKTSESQFRTFF